MLTQIATLKGHTGKPCAMATSADGTVLVSTSADLTVRVWDPETWSIRHVIDDMDAETRQPISVFDVSACGKYLATGMADFTTKVYSLETGERILRLHPVKSSYYNVAEQIRFPLVGDYLACAKGRSIELFHIGDFSRTMEFKGHTSKAHLIAYAPNGKTLISCGGKFVKLWSLETFAERATLTRHSRLLGSLAVAASGQFFVTGGEDNRVFLWTLPDGKEMGEYVGHTNFVFDLAISPDGKTVASWDMSQTLHLWDAATCQTIARLSGISGQSVFLPGDDLLIFFGVVTGTQLINATNGEVIQRIPPSNDVAVAPDGSWFASFDGNDIVVWGNGRDS